MRLANYLATAGVAGALALGAVTAASAQTVYGSWDNGWNRTHVSTWNDGWDNGWRGRPLVSAQVGLNTGYGYYSPGYYGPGVVNTGVLVEAPVAARVDNGFYGPRAYGWNGWGNGCVTDEGYGRTLPCDHGGGF